MLHDLKHAYRMLWHTKGWTLVVLLSLAIGIGATTALFTAVNGLLLQTVPFPIRSRSCGLQRPATTTCGRRSSDYGFSQPHEGQNVRASFSIRDVSAAARRQPDDDRPDRRRAARAVQRRRRTARPRSPPRSACRATTSACCGVPPALGRAIEETDDRAGAEPVAVISHALLAAPVRRSITSIVGQHGSDEQHAGHDRRRARRPSFTGMQRLGGRPPRCDRAVCIDASIRMLNLPASAKRRMDEPTTWWLQIDGPAEARRRRSSR